MNIGQQCNYVSVDFTKFKPSADYILVKPIERVASKIIAVVLDEKPNIGMVVAVGPGKRDKRDRLQPLDVMPGQIVRFGEFAFPIVMLNAEQHLLMREPDIAGVVIQVPRESLAA